MQEAFFFGPPTRQIFGSYHPPAGGDGRVLTVICPPLFAEQHRTHMALRSLAVELAAAGHHVLRFDYRGTGDSGGELDECSVADWLEDIVLTVREGREISDSSVVRVLGVRAGALLACKSVGASPDINRFVLWDPVADGTTYLQALRRAQAEECEGNLYLERAERREAMREYAGYTLSVRMVEDLGALGADSYSNVAAGRLFMVTTTTPEAGIPVQGAPLNVAPFSCNWDTIAGAIIMPRPVLERLFACLTRP